MNVSCGRRRPPSETLLGRDLDHVHGQPSQLSGRCQHIVELHCEPLGSATCNHCIQNDLRPCLGTIDNGIRGQLVGKAARSHEEQPDTVWISDAHLVGVYLALIVRYAHPVIYAYFLLLCSMTITHLRYPSNVPVDWHRPY